MGEQSVVEKLFDDKIQYLNYGDLIMLSLKKKIF